MPIGDFDKTKSLVVQSVSGTPTVGKAQPIYLTSGDDSTTGTGEIVLDWSGISGPEDVAVYDQNDNLLDYEIEELDTTNETGVIWAYNSWTRDGTFQAKVAYGNGPGDNQNVSGTWNNTGQKAEMVQHLQDDPLTGTDSSPNDYDAGSVIGVTSTSGEFSKAGLFDGSDDTVKGFGIPNLSSYTVVAWALQETPDDGSIDRIVNLHNNNHWQIRCEGDGRIRVAQKADGNFSSIYASEAGGAWNNWITTWDGSTVELFKNASSAGTMSRSGMTNHGSGDYIGGHDLGQHWDGKIDEVRVYTEQKSTDWVQADYDASAKAGQTFYSQEAATSTVSPTDYSKTKNLVVDSVTGTPTVDKAQPIYLTSGDDSQTGTGEIVLDWSGISGPEDVAVYDQNDNLLDYEIEELDTTNETGVIWVYNSWVRDGTVQAKVAYGNGPGDNQNASAVWTNDSATFDGVYHLNGDAIDSTQNANDGTVNGATVASGEFADAYDFDGQDDYIDTNFMHDAESYFCMVWLHTDAINTGNNQVDAVSSMNSGADNGFRIIYEDGEGIWLDFRSDRTSPYAINADENYLVSFYIDNAASEAKLYIDGVEKETLSNELWSTDKTIKIGRISTLTGNNPFYGMIDEVKMGPSVISQDYMQAEYDASAKAGQTFYSQESATTTGGGGSIPPGIARTDNQGVRQTGSDGVIDAG